MLDVESSLTLAADISETEDKAYTLLSHVRAARHAACCAHSAGAALEKARDLLAEVAAEIDLLVVAAAA